MQELESKCVSHRSPNSGNTSPSRGIIIPWYHRMRKKNPQPSPCAIAWMRIPLKSGSPGHHTSLHAYTDIHSADKL